MSSSACPTPGHLAGPDVQLWLVFRDPREILTAPSPDATEPHFAEFAQISDSTSASRLCHEFTQSWGPLAFGRPVRRPERPDFADPTA
jgi:hypothetical protein